MLHEQFQHQNVANSIENERFELKHAANTLETQLPAPKCYKFHQNVANSIENERFQLQDIARTVEMAASSSQMLQIARKTGRKTDPQKSAKNGKKMPTQFWIFSLKRCFLCFPNRFFPETWRRTTPEAPPPSCSRWLLTAGRPRNPLQNRRTTSKALKDAVAEARGGKNARVSPCFTMKMGDLIIMFWWWFNHELLEVEWACHGI